MCEHQVGAVILAFVCEEMSSAVVHVLPALALRCVVLAAVDELLLVCL